MACSSSEPVRKKTDPFWELRFVYYMLALPPAVREKYTRIKTRRGQERVARYLEQVENARQKNVDVDPRDIVEKIRKLPAEKQASLLSTRGTWSRDRIRYEYDLGENIARAVVAGLSMETSEES